MKTLYIETSALLAWLFNENRADETIEKINQSDIIVTSALTRLETERALMRAEKTRLASAAERQSLLGLFRRVSSGWYFLSVSNEILMRAGIEFPVEPIRSLDAIHLASALESVQLFQNVSVLSFDNRINDKLAPLGLLT